MRNACFVVGAISIDIFQLFEQLPSRAMAVLPALSAGLLQGCTLGSSMLSLPVPSSQPS